MIFTRAVLGQLGEASLLVSIILAIFMGLRPVLRKALGSQWLCALWLALLARLLMPWPLECRLGLIEHWGRGPERFASAGAWKVKAGVTGAGNESARATGQATFVPAVAASPASAGPEFSALAGGAWAAGFLVSLGILAWRWEGTRRLARNTEPVTDERLERLFGSIPQNLRRSVGLRMTRRADVPTLAGMFRPQIWMPLGWPGKFSDAELRNILLHELGHARRGDLAVQWLFALAQCIHWWNPLVWLAVRTAHFDREMACDSWVLAHGKAGNIQYGTALIKAAQILRGPFRVLPAGAAMASSRQSLYARISGIGAHRPMPAWRGLAGVLAMIAALASATTFRSAAADGAAPGGSPSGTPVTSPASSPSASAKEAHGDRVIVVAKFIEITDEAWKKLCATNSTFQNMALRSPELAQKSEAALRDEAMSDQKDSMEKPPAVLIPRAFEDLLKSIDQRPGIDLLSAPGVTTPTGRKAVVEMVQEFHYPTKFDKDSAPTEFTTKNTGVTLEVTPRVGSDGAIKLTLKPIITHFIGFRRAINGKEMLAPRDSGGRFDHPVFSTLESEFDVQLWDNQTVMIGGAKVLRKPIDGGENRKFGIERRVELVFVTARIADLPPGIPYAVPVKGNVGFVTSPYAPDKGMIDVRGFSSGSQIKDPYTGRTLLVP